MFRKFSFCAFFVICFLFIQSSFAAFPKTSGIITIGTMQEVEKYADKDTLVLFDLDHTIFESGNYGYGHANWFYDEIEKAKAQGIEETITIKKIFPHWLYSQQTAYVKPVEELTPKLIRKLQSNRIRVLGLTSRQVPLVDITLNQLNRIHVNFSAEDLPSTSLSMQFNAPTMMKEGIIFCSEYNDKGKVLHAYLDKLSISPKKIVFIDDGLKNLQSVINAYSDQAIVVGLHYPLVGEYKKGHWDAKRAHQEYCRVSLQHPQFFESALDCA